MRSPEEIAKAERRENWRQALASTRIEGHEPSPEYLEDIEANINGEMSSEELRRRISERCGGGGG